MLSLFHFRHNCHHDRRLMLLFEKTRKRNQTFQKRDKITIQIDGCSCSADVVTCVFI